MYLDDILDLARKLEWTRHAHRAVLYQHCLCEVPDCIGHVLASPIPRFTMFHSLRVSIKHFRSLCRNKTISVALLKCLTTFSVDLSLTI